MVMIPENQVKCVVFLCVEKTDASGITSPVPVATGFFVRRTHEDGNGRFSFDYLVTARHVVDEAREFGALFIRINTAAGGFIELKAPLDDWFVHDSADVAAILMLPSAFPPGINTYDEISQASLTMHDFVGPGPEYRYTGNIPEYGPVEFQPRVGCEIFFMGLFTQSYGRERNLPVARFGNIARMPDRITLLRDDHRVDVIAYLAEFHSFGGHSGSPVFFVWPMTFLDEVGSATFGWVTGFMGLVSGHYDVPTKAKHELGPIQVALNSGIAIVTPAEAVTTLLSREDLVRQRTKLAEQRPNEPVPNLDFLQGGEPAFTREE